LTNAIAGKVILGKFTCPWYRFTKGLTGTQSLNLRSN